MEFGELLRICETLDPDHDGWRELAQLARAKLEEATQLEEQISTNLQTIQSHAELKYFYGSFRLKLLDGLEPQALDWTRRKRLAAQLAELYANLCLLWEERRHSAEDLDFSADTARMERIFALRQQILERDAAIGALWGPTSVRSIASTSNEGASQPVSSSRAPQLEESNKCPVSPPVDTQAEEPEAASVEDRGVGIATLPENAVSESAHDATHQPEDRTDYPDSLVGTRDSASSESCPEVEPASSDSEAPTTESPMGALAARGRNPKSFVRRRHAGKTKGVRCRFIGFG